MLYLKDGYVPGTSEYEPQLNTPKGDVITEQGERKPITLKGDIITELGQKKPIEVSVEDNWTPNPICTPNPENGDLMTCVQTKKEFIHQKGSSAVMWAGRRTDPPFIKMNVNYSIDIANEKTVKDTLNRWVKSQGKL